MTVKWAEIAVNAVQTGSTGAIIDARMIPMFLLMAAAAAVQDLERTEPPNLADRPAALVGWQWPDCTMALANETATFAEAMCRAAAARTKSDAARDLRDAGAARHTTDALAQLRRAVSLAASPLDKRAALRELAVTAAGFTGSNEADLAWREFIGTQPDDPMGHLALAHLQDARGAIEAEEATLVAARQAAPRSREIVETLARLYRRTGRIDDAIASVQAFADFDASDPSRQWLVAAWYRDLEHMPELASRSAEFVAAGLKAIEAALSLQPDYLEALTFKDALLRLAAERQAGAAERQATLAEADRIRLRILELQRQRQDSRR
jgi:predicted Zn-dependent protease